MNQPNPTPPVAELPKQSFFTPALIRNLIISVIVIVILIAGSLVWLNSSKKHQVEILVANDKVIIDNLFAIRLESLQFYDKNFSYKEWGPDFQKLEAIKVAGSEVTLRKSDYQTYIMYSYLPNEKKYFCIDTFNYADKLDQITTAQVRCVSKQ